MFWEFLIIFVMMILWVGGLMSAPFLLFKFEQWADKIIIRKQKSK